MSDDLKGVSFALMIYNNRRSEEVILHSVLEKVIETSKEIFTIIDEYRDEFVSEGDKPITFYDEAHNRLTGCYMYLSPIVATIESLKEVRSLSFYHKKKIDIEKDGGKFVSASTEKEADLSVSEIAYMLAIFEGYLDSSKQGIQTCRAKLKDQTDAE